MKFFKKKHTIYPNNNNNNNNNSVKFIEKGCFGFYFCKAGFIDFIQYKALIFFIKKRLKFCSRIYIRLSNSLKATKKPIGIRMGKGKGGIDNYYLPVNKGQVFIEFFFRKFRFFLFKKKKFLRLIKKIFLVFSKRIKIKIKFLRIF